MEADLSSSNPAMRLLKFIIDDELQPYAVNYVPDTVAFAVRLSTSLLCFFILFLLSLSYVILINALSSFIIRQFLSRQAQSHLYSFIFERQTFRKLLLNLSIDSDLEKLLHLWSCKGLLAQIILMNNY